MNGFVLPVFGSAMLAAAAFGLGAAALRTVTEPPGMPNTEIDQAQTQVVETRSGETASRSPRAEIYYDAVTDRPLFSETRRPRDAEAPELEPVPAPVVTQTPEPPPAPPDITMHGVITTSDQSSALLGIDGAAPEWIALNTDISGWVLTEIGPDWVRITRDSQTLKVEMY